MQFTTVATILGLAAAGLAAPATTPISTLEARQKPTFERGWCGIHMKLVYGDYHQATIDVKDASGKIIVSEHQKVSTDSWMTFKFQKGLPGNDVLTVTTGGVEVGNNQVRVPSFSPVFFFFFLICVVADFDFVVKARIEYKGQDIYTGPRDTQNANCKVGKADYTSWYNDRMVINLDCGFTC